MRKTFVRYNEGAAIYSMGITTFKELAKDAGAIYRIKDIVLVNTELVDQYLENFREDYRYCLPLDGDCYMMKIGFTNSSLCRYFERMILPEEPEIINIIFKNREKLRACKYCRKQFVAYGNKQYCSSKCASIAGRKSTKERVRRLRNKRG